MVKNAYESGRGLSAIQAFSLIPACKRACFAAHLLLELNDGCGSDVDLAVLGFDT